MTILSHRSRTLLPAALTLALACWGAAAAPPEKSESPIDKEPATQMTPETPPKATTAMTAKPALGSGMQTQFDARDSNRDGFIDKAEAKADANLTSQFNALDTDKDGRLSGTEFMNAKNLATLKPKHGTTDRQ